ncbi:polyketide synthase [Aspergillus sclerotioniger CBS 115572]|uniref:Polyketide synthase n=1 Tax=Aspergillus sclerotioniger CBS 115572 TaxID=1450535 RepID=A0A317X469_9EURO|nr:polyketide synthase [Aspergillus sclerotioniger CBS 115572]PWY91350.1 polyketide synthase [Aspergillus sclerotioniger CBS 115572]
METPSSNNTAYNALEEGSLAPLAVVGISLKFPQDATSPEAFWDMLVQGRCVSGEFPRDRMNIDAHHDADRDRLHSLSCRGAHFLKEDLGRFDAPFFGMSDADAKAMDPQQRLALETVYRALENAGLPVEHVASSKTSVFAGSFCSDYHMIQIKDPLNVPKNAIAGSGRNMISNRISWFFDFLGPSATIDTACSSSLMAVDLACQSIWGGDANMGIAIGCNIILAPEMTIGLDNLGLLSRDSHCYSFDSRANGYARGEGVGAIVIKRLDDAVSAGDTIRAVIRSSSSNQDGRTPGILQPSKNAQVRLIQDTYRKAGLDMDTTRYFEAHGTGTPIGDPIESRAIGTAFREYRSGDAPLYVGSVKSNIGHLEGASGIAGFIKAVLVLEKGIIPPNSSNLQVTNSQIDEDYMRLKIIKGAIAWPTTGLRRASVSSFGFGGANSHIVLDDAYNSLRLWGYETGHHDTVVVPLKQVNDSPQMPDHGKADRTNSHISRVNDANDDNICEYRSAPRLFVWSATDKAGITRLAESWNSYFSTPIEVTEAYMRDLAYTLCDRRTHWAWRTFVVANSAVPIQNITAQFAPATQCITSPHLAFAFTGQGAQWYAMGRELISHYEVFTRSLSDSGTYFKELGCEWDAIEELQKPELESKVTDPVYGQPLCTALQIALVDLLESWEISPAAVVGHSSGEIAAAYCSGALSKRSALKIAYFRGYVAGLLGGSSDMKGGMLAVGLSKEEVQKYLDALASQFEALKVVVACINSPRSITISGELQQIEALHDLLNRYHVFSRKLTVNVAYHSFQMREVSDRYHTILGDLEMSCKRKRKPPFMVSSVTGTVVSNEQLVEPEYWVNNMISPVLFHDAVSYLCSHSEKVSKKIDGSHRRTVAINHLLEIGPHSALQGPCRDIVSAMERSDKVSYVPLLVRKRSPLECIMEAAGRLHCSGYTVKLSLINADGLAKAQRSPRVLIDLPEYPFNHSTSYWHESRLSKGYRLRRYGYLELLGTPEPNGNPMEASWRNIIRVSDMPWVQDHKINNTILYPGAGMVIMAIEAVKQLADLERPIAGFSVRDAVFLSALQIPTHAEGIEVNVHLKRTTDRKADATGWFEYRIYAYDNGAWVENGAGSIQALYEARDAGLEANRREESAWESHLLEGFSGAAQSCISSVNADEFYKLLRLSGYQYGPEFSAIQKIGYREGSYNNIVSDIRTFRPTDTGGPGTYPTHTIHPTTFDGIIQMAAGLETDVGRRVTNVAVPTRIDRLWLSNSGGLSHPSANIVKAYATRSQSAVGYTYYSMTAVNSDVSKALLTLEGLKVTAIASTEKAHISNHFKADNFCHFIERKPDIDLLTSSEAWNLYGAHDPQLIEPVQQFTELDFLAATYISRYATSFHEEDRQPLPHINKYVDWALDYNRTLDQGISRFSAKEWRDRMNDDEYIRKLHERVESGSKRGLLVSTVCRNLGGFIRDPLALLFNNNLLADVYYEMLRIGSGSSQLERFIGELAHKNPQMKILEIGAGTGAMTATCLKALTMDFESGTSLRCYSQWDFTDISSSFFPSAQNQFAAEGQSMRFKVLDIEQDPEAQGFECGTYDMVVAFLVLHATANLSASLRNVRKLLKGGGKLLLFEITHLHPVRTNLVFGLLDGWWRGTEAYRQKSPCISSEKWGELLKETGFSGCDLVLDDYNDKVCREGSMIVSTAVAPRPTQRTSTAVNIILDPRDQIQADLAMTLSDCLQKIGLSGITQRSLSDTLSRELSPDVLDICLLESTTPFLYNMKKTDYEGLQGLVSSTRNLIWVGEGGGRQPLAKSGLIDGLFRVLTGEMYRARLTTLSLERNTSREHQAEQIIKIVRSVAADTDRTADTEYTEIDGILHINRLVPARPLSQEVARKVLPQQRGKKPYGLGPPLRLNIGSPGLLNTLHFVEDRSQEKPLGPKEILIKVKAVGLNFRDVLVALGRLETDTLGAEFSGEVVQIGRSCQKFQPGDRVVAFHPSRYANYVRVQEDMPVAKIRNEKMSFVTAAAIPVAYATAWITLSRTANLQAGESILIHSGAGGTGQAAIHVAQYLGATVFATVSTEEKKQLLMDRCHIPAEHIFSSRNTLFAKGIRRLTQGRGVDVVLNSLSGDGLVASWESVAPYGRFVEIGKNDILSNSKLPMLQFERNVSFMAIDLAGMMAERPHLITAALEKVFSMLEDGKISLVHPLQLLGIAEIEHAFRQMQTGKNSGKTVLEMRETDEVMTVVDTKPSFSFPPDATYVIAGGLGGLGRSIARWLVERGARNLLLLSRSGQASPHARSLVEELHARGARVITPACDITNRELLKTVLSVCSQLMPPIKGCVQATMVVSAQNFESLDYESWKSTTTPKAQGSWNLHKLLPQGMDFFVMMSSVAGILGTIGDPGYAAGNTFKDGLARHRVAQGEKAVSLGLGPILTAGYLKDNPDRREYFLSHNVLDEITELELHAILDTYCDPNRDQISMLESQVVVGITPTMREHGMHKTDWLDRPLFRHLALINGAGGGSTEDSNLAALFAGASSTTEAAGIAMRATREKLSVMMSMPVDEIDTDKPIHQYGVDSLAAVELRNWFARELRADLAMFDILGSASIASVVAVAVGKSEYRRSDSALSDS